MAFDRTLRSMLTDTTDADWHVFFYATIEGLPYIFTSVGITSLESDFIPAGFTTATIKDLLKVGHGLDSITESASRWSGVAETTEITIALGPDEDDFLLDLFSYDPDDLAETRLTQTYAWSDVTMHVEDTTDFASSGLVHIGMTAVIYTGKTGTTFTGCSSAAYGGALTEYMQDEDLNKGTVIVRDRPINFEGRILHLYMGRTSPTGAVMQTIQPMEIYAGPIASMPIADDWVTWSFRVRDLTALLDQTVGGYPYAGHLLGPADLDTSQYCWTTVLLEQGVNARLKMSLTISFTDGVGAQYLTAEINSQLTDGWRENILVQVNEALASAIAASDLADYAQVTVYQMSTVFIGEDDTGDEYSIATRNHLRVRWDMSALSTDYPTIATQVALTAATSNVDQDSVWPMMGFTRPIYLSDLTDASSDVTSGQMAPALPMLYQLTERSRYLPVIYDQAVAPHVSQTLPDSGYISIARQEVASYESVDDVDPLMSSMTMITLSGRQLAGGGIVSSYSLIWIADEYGLRPQAVIDGEVKEAQDVEAIEVRSMWGLIQSDIMDIILTLMISTGGNRYAAGTYAEWDSASVGDMQGAQIPGPLIDVESFTRIGDELLDTLTIRDLLFSESMSLHDLIDDELQLLGCCIVPMSTDDGYRLSLVRTDRMMTMSMYSVSYDSTGDIEVSADVAHNPIPIAGTDPADRPRLRHDLAQLVNRMSIQPLWDPAAEQSLETEVIVNEIDSQTEYRMVSERSLSLRGFGASEGRALQIAWAVAPGVLARYAWRYPIIELYTTRSGWAYSPGDQVTVTIPGIPTESGVRGYRSRVVTVLRVDKTYFDPGSDLCCKIYGLVVQQGRYAYYAPSATVPSSGTDGTYGPYLVLYENAYSDEKQPNIWGLEAGDVEDLVWFAAATRIRVYNRGDDDAGEDLTVTGYDLAQNRIYVQALPSLAIAAATTRITYSDWDDEGLDESQRSWCYIADNTGTLTDYESDKSRAFQWGF